MKKFLVKEIITDNESGKSIVEWVIEYPAISEDDFPIEFGYVSVIDFDTDPENMTVAQIEQIVKDVEGDVYTKFESEVEKYYIIEKIKRKNHSSE